MNRTVKLAKQGVMVALVAVMAAFVGAQVTVQKVAVKPGVHYVFVDDNTKTCATC